jgi:hypothetical protein
LLGLALLYALLNAPKPLLIDDAAYYYYAKQIAHDPLRPYAFDMFWYQWPHPAIEILAPPGLPYWWAVAYRIFGEQPVLWKLWLLPYCVLFVFALHALFRRFARGLEMPLVVLTLFSPTFLPSLDLMLDVPALALCVGAVTLFFHACARSSIGLTLLAGLLAGLGMETKYTGFLAPCVILLYAILFRRIALGIAAVTVAGLLFAGWEYLIFLYHGKSHFLVNVRDQGDLGDKLNLIGPLCTLIGGVSPAVTLLGLAALGVRAWKVALVGGGLTLGYVAIALYRGTIWVEAGSGAPEVFAAANTVVGLESLIFGAFGLLSFGVTAVVLWRLLVGEEEDVDVVPVDTKDSTGGLRPPLAELEKLPYPWWQSPFLRIDLFLLFWLLGETTAFFFLTPFPAVRRVMGIMVVGTLVAGRLASRTCRERERRWLIHGITAAGVALGFVFYGVDLLDAFASKRLAEGAAAVVRQHDPNARVWYVGHWGFQFYAEQAGMKPVVPGGWSQVTPSTLQAGDWLVVPEPRLNQQTIQIEPECSEAVTDIVVETSVPLRTVQCFYGGRVPLEHHDGPRGRVTIYRVTADFVPWSKRD